MVSHGTYGVPNHRDECLFNSLFRLTTNKTPDPRFISPLRGWPVDSPNKQLIIRLAHSQWYRTELISWRLREVEKGVSHNWIAVSISLQIFAYDTKQLSWHIPLNTFQRFMSCESTENTQHSWPMTIRSFVSVGILYSSWLAGWRTKIERDFCCLLSTACNKYTFVIQWTVCNSHANVDPYIRQLARSSFVQVKASRLYVAKPLAKTKITYF